MQEVADIQFEGVNIKAEGIVEVQKKVPSSTAAAKDQMPSKQEDLKSNPPQPS